MDKSKRPPLPTENEMKVWLSTLTPDEQNLANVLRQMPEKTVIGEALKAEREAAARGSDPLEQFKRARAEKHIRAALEASKDAIAQSECQSGLAPDVRPAERLIRKKGLGL
jgi:hypothetical protein